MSTHAVQSPWADFAVAPAAPSPWHEAPAGMASTVPADAATAVFALLALFVPHDAPFEATAALVPLAAHDPAATAAYYAPWTKSLTPELLAKAPQPIAAESE